MLKPSMITTSHYYCKIGLKTPIPIPTHELENKKTYPKTFIASREQNRGHMLMPEEKALPLKP